MEPLLHFAIPFALAALFRPKLKWVLIVGVIALLPDLDVLSFMHRSISHTLLPALLLLPPSLLLRKRAHIKLILPAISLGWGSHVLLDALGGYTPLLWPLSQNTYQLTFQSTLAMQSSPSISLSLQVLQQPYDYGVFTTLEAPLFTASGVAIALVLIALVLSIYYPGLRGVVDKLRQKIG